MVPFIVAGLVLAVVIFSKMVFVLKEYERGVVYFMGRFTDVRGPGFTLLIPFIQNMVRIDIRTITMDVPSQDVITKDNISVKVNAVLYFRVVDPARAINSIENYLFATSQLAQTTLRSVCGEVALDDILQKREELNLRIQDIVDTNSDPWGIKVGLVEIKHIDLPQEMQRSIARQAEAERDRRAKVIQAEGEFQAAAKLRDAARIMAEEPITVQLRYLDSLRAIATEHNSTIVFPLPMEFMKLFTKEK